MLSMYCNSNQHDWDRYLQKVMIAYRLSVHSKTGQTPNKTVFGHDNILPLQALVGLPPNPSHDSTESSTDYTIRLHARLELIHHTARVVPQTTL
ncbi:hypothetical protein DPMN_109923 [Dreissena polymorpha]|uniref:Uncharacterized protein n=1 Tax=Dreissena polymorpha TaxID=45954 RepID=A0A9D4QMG1_DREPO|nr:hypothetical protein DPMN_109923 [Dreissena polymorpha]